MLIEALEITWVGRWKQVETGGNVWKNYQVYTVPITIEENVEHLENDQRIFEIRASNQHKSGSPAPNMGVYVGK
jgi:hypothetical protein